MTGAVTPPDPETIGRFRIERLIGRGAMGLVYLAHDPAIDRRVAIKLVRADLLDTEDQATFLDRFQREAQAAACCMHPNIVTIFDLATHEGNPFIAMEFVDGVSLAQRCPRGTVLDMAGASTIILQVLAALQAAHAQGVVHRDIKPANVLLTPADLVKITDFGIARLALSNLTQSGAIVGTLSYMAPEQCRGDDVDHRADLFAACCILHELLLGTRPFPGSNEGEIMRRLLQEPPFVPPGHTLSTAMLAVLERGLAKEPAQRFASAEDMAAALNAAAHTPDHGDATVIQASPRARSAPVRPEWNEAVLAELSRELASYIGPIARAMVQSASRRAPDLESLRDILSAAIDKPEDRGFFLGGSASVPSKFGSAGTPSKSGSAGAGLPGASRAEPADPSGSDSGASIAKGVDEPMQAAARKALAKHVGPIASILVRRALAGAPGAAEFWERLATHIDSPEERAAFLRSWPGAWRP